MYMKRKLLGVVFAATAFIFASCSRASYEAQPLQTMKAKPKQEEKVIVLYKPLTRKESVHYLDRDWQKRGIQPIQVAIENLTDHPMKFSQQGISLPTVDVETLTSYAHASTGLKAMSVGAPSITMMAVGIAGLVLAPATFGLAGVLVPIGLGGIGLQTASNIVKSDRSLDEDYRDKYLHDRVIPPNGTVEGLIFVRVRDCKGRFSMKFTDATNEEPILVDPRRLRG